MNKSIIVCFKNTEIPSTKTSVSEAVEALLCTYCTLDWKYDVQESANEVRVKVTMIEKHKFPEHKCKNTLAPCGKRITYYKAVDD